MLKEHESMKYGGGGGLTLILQFAAMDLFCGDCKQRSGCTLRSFMFYF